MASITIVAVASAVQAEVDILFDRASRPVVYTTPTSVGVVLSKEEVEGLPLHLLWAVDGEEVRAYRTSTPSGPHPDELIGVYVTPTTSSGGAEPPFRLSSDTHALLLFEEVNGV